MKYKLQSHLFNQDVFKSLKLEIASEGKVRLSSSGHFRMKANCPQKCRFRAEPGRVERKPLQSLDEHWWARRGMCVQEEAGDSAGRGPI